MFQPIIFGILQDLPLLAASGVVIFVAITLLTPNPRRFGIIGGWLFAEMMEHITIPAVFLITMTIFPPAFLIALPAMIFPVYGRLTGFAGTAAEWLGVLGIYLTFVGIMFMPAAVIMAWRNWNIDGWVSLTLITAGSVMIYMWRRRK
jgi:hypothetical protein